MRTPEVEQYYLQVGKHTFEDALNRKLAEGWLAYPATIHHGDLMSSVLLYKNRELIPSLPGPVRGPAGLD